jgi:Gpi18-like mannosyltransferase
VKKRIRNIFKNKLTFLLCLGLLVRFSLIYFQYSGDVGNHLAWGRGALSSFKGFYDNQFEGFNQPNYPPLTIILFALSAKFYSLIHDLVIFLNQTIKIFPSSLVPLVKTLNTQSAFLKIPAILSDLGIAWLIYKLVPVKKVSKKLLLTSLYLFNPAVIYISTIWGQIESIPILFILLSFFFLKKEPSLKKQKLSTNYFLSHIFFTLAILSKQTALWISPIFLVLWLKDIPFKYFLKGLLIQILTFTLVYLPFTQNLLTPFTLYLNTLKGSSNLVSDAAWNIWHFFYPPHTLDSIILFGVSIRTWSITMVLVSMALVLKKFLYKKITSTQSLFYLSIIVFFFQTRVHERHLFPSLVFLLLFPKFSKNTFFLFLLLTSYHFFNLYWSLRLPFI